MGGNTSSWFRFHILLLLLLAILENWCLAIDCDVLLVICQWDDVSMELNCHIVIAVVGNLHVQGLNSVELRLGEFPNSCTGALNSCSSRTNLKIEERNNVLWGHGHALISTITKPRAVACLSFWAETKKTQEYHARAYQKHAPAFL